MPAIVSVRPSSIQLAHHWTAARSPPARGRAEAAFDLVLDVEVAPQVVADALDAAVGLLEDERPVEGAVRVQGGDRLDVLGRPGALPGGGPAAGSLVRIHRRG